MVFMKVNDKMTNKLAGDDIFLNIQRMLKMIFTLDNDIKIKYMVREDTNLIIIMFIKDNLKVTK